MELDGLILEASTPERSSGAKAVPPAQPVFLLAPPRSHSALVGAMVGQHPQMCGLPETHLFNAPTVTKWWEMCDASTFRMADGLLRAVAELFYGYQTDETILAAEGWLRRRDHYTTSLVFEELMDRVPGRVLVEGSCTFVSRPAALQRILRNFPLARFVHLTRHPRAFGEYLMKGIEEAARLGPVPYWMLNLASLPGPSASEDGTPHQNSGFDPQRAWYELNAKAGEFLKLVPTDRKMVLRIEDLFSDTKPNLQRVAGWLGLRTDDEAVEAMTNPERSPFARPGPSRAPFGNEGGFLQNPTFEPPSAQAYVLDGPLSWRQDGQGFLPRVKELAQQFGYR
jgi:hypothetical protein